MKLDEIILRFKLMVLRNLVPATTTDLRNTHKGVIFCFNIPNFVSKLIHFSRSMK